MSPTILFSALLEFADIWMVRKMLLNLRERIQAIEPATTSQEELPRRH